ncbi:hypothetical protein [Roseobacter sp. S98]|uniref:hypothetical protein n=1 Tax=Roseobacter algicola (ex Choi et al. 2025) (nom. illeg.) TaxID=3092138 RepID=UPI0035C66C53
MMNNNKILTVSYGTFSCTLEGFDDSFDTMKAIAEYFRDLAADDRYFGAEPPQPDAELLARIAEREVSRRVEAREQDGRIMLKAQDGDGPAAAPENNDAPVAPAAAAATAAAAAPQVMPEPEPAPADIAPTETPAPQPAAWAPEPIATEAAVDPAMVAPEEAWVPPVAAETAEVAVAEAHETPAPLDMAFDAPTEPTAEPAPAETFPAAPVEVAEDAAAFFADSPAVDDTFFDADANAPTEVEMPGFVTPDTESAAKDVPLAEDTGMARSESIADRLARIRAVVSRHDDADADVDVDYEEEIADSAPPPVEFAGTPMPDFSSADEEFEGVTDQDETDTLTAAAAGIHDAFAADEVSADLSDATEDVTADTGEDEDDLSAMLQRIEAGDLADEDAEMEPETGSSEQTEPEHSAEAGFEDLAQAEEIIHVGEMEDVRTDETEFSTDKDENLFARDDAETEVVEELFDTPDAFIHDDGAVVADAADDAGEPEAAGGEDSNAPVTARVMKVSTEELDAALESGALETLDADAEEAGESIADRPAARDTLPDIGEDAGVDVSRLMAEADHQMEEPEGATRRSAFAHLRAAVAARFADKSMDADEEKGRAAADAYRSDLAEVVKPRRPVADGPTRTDRPETSQTAPLKLVAEQRISDDETPAAPVAPRRVAAAFADDADMASDTGFAAFAEEVGATKLPELLEAAAAYMAFVEGQEQFSRPQLMTRVRQAEGGDCTREDGLRSFGQLLRAGKIEKMQGGRFAASEAIGYRPDERAAG